MGYNSIDVVKGSTTAIGVQFENVAVPEAGIPVKSIVTVSAPKAATKADNTADQIWIFNGASWTKYFYYTANPRNPTDAKWCLDTDTQHQEIPDTVVLKAGQSFFFRRSSSADATLTLAGGVVPLTDIKEYPVTKGSTVAMTWPWPDAMKIKDFNNYNSAPKAATKADNTADQLWVFNGASWTKYFYYTANPRNPTDAKWCLDTDEKHEDIGDDKIITAGAGFFFRRSSSADAVISFKR